MRDIKNFRIGKAYYIIENDLGSKLRVEVDYGENRFKYIVLMKGGKLNRLKRQADIIAKDMLDRKSQKNLKYKLLQLKV